MIAEPLEKGLAEDIENEVVQIKWTKWDIDHLSTVSSPENQLLDQLDFIPSIITNYINLIYLRIYASFILFLYLGASEVAKSASGFPK